MRLAPKNFYFIYASTTMWSPSKYIPCACTHLFRRCCHCSIPGTYFVGCRLRPALQTAGCLLLTQNGVLSLPILLFEIKRSRKVRDQVSITVMHLDVKNCAPPRIPMLLCEIPEHHLGTNFSYPQFFSQYQTNGFPVHVHFISNHSDW